MSNKKGLIKSKKKQVKYSPTLGPVADLEKHLPSDWWANIFNSLYLKTDADVVENSNNTQKDVDTFIAASKIKPNQTILDLCCGQGRHSIELYGRGYKNVIGIDRSSYLIRLAKNRAAKLGYHIKFSEGDARKVRLPESSLDCVVLFCNSFGYFEAQEDDVEVLNSIINVLKSKGKLVMDITDGAWMRKNFESSSWEWIDKNHITCRERSLAKDKTRIISREIVINAKRGIIADQFYAERTYTFSEMRSILKRLNFTDIVLHGNLKASSTNSTATLDLGMTAHRMFITATAPIKKCNTKVN